MSGEYLGLDDFDTGDYDEFDDLEVDSSPGSKSKIGARSRIDTLMERRRFKEMMALDDYFGEEE